MTVKSPLDLFRGAFFDKWMEKRGKYRMVYGLPEHEMLIASLFAIFDQGAAVRLMQLNTDEEKIK